MAMVKTPFLHKQPAKKLLGIDLVSLEKGKGEAPLFPVLLEPLGFFQGEQGPGTLRRIVPEKTPPPGGGGGGGYCRRAWATARMRLRSMSVERVQSAPRRKFSGP